MSKSGSPAVGPRFSRFWFVTQTDGDVVESPDETFSFLTRCVRGENQYSVGYSRRNDGSSEPSTRGEHAINGDPGTAVGGGHLFQHKGTVGCKCQLHNKTPNNINERCIYEFSAVQKRPLVDPDRNWRGSADLYYGGLVANISLCFKEQLEHTCLLYTS
ncbi:MAG: hypothetical protein N3G20_05240, partial [Verrucomicrobiae bacterium]|nr:hypothetical protein [Verrucomicrobiae bacterium]